MLPIHLGIPRIRAAEDQRVQCSGDRLLRARKLQNPFLGQPADLLAEQALTAERVLNQQILNHPRERLTLVGRALARLHSQITPFTGRIVIQWSYGAKNEL